MRQPNFVGSSLVVIGGSEKKLCRAWNYHSESRLVRSIRDEERRTADDFTLCTLQGLV